MYRPGALSKFLQNNKWSIGKFYYNGYKFYNQLPEEIKEIETLQESLKRAQH